MPDRVVNSLVNGSSLLDRTIVVMRDSVVGIARGIGGATLVEASGNIGITTTFIRDLEIGIRAYDRINT